MDDAPSVIEAVCIRDVVENGILDDSELQSLRDVLRRMIAKVIAFEEAVLLVNDECLRSGVLDQANLILSTELDPIPDVEAVVDTQRLKKKKQLKTWTTYEDMRLIMGVYKHGTMNWKKVSIFVGNHRTSAQCSQRWERTIDPEISKKPWTYEEEEILERAVQNFGCKSWIKIAKILKTRTDVQCRYHYKYVMKGTSPKALKVNEIKKEMQERNMNANNIEISELLNKIFANIPELNDESIFWEESQFFRLSNSL